MMAVYAQTPDFGHERGREHEEAARQLPGRERFVEEEVTGHRREHALQRQDDGGVSGRGVVLAHRHEGEPETLRDRQEDQPRKEHPDVVPQPLLGLQGEGGEAGEQRDHPQLDAHHGYRVDVGGGHVRVGDVQGPENGRDHGQRLAHAQLQVVVRRALGNEATNEWMNGQANDRVNILNDGFSAIK